MVEAASKLKVTEYTEVNTEAGRALVRDESRNAIAAVDGLIFDVDGVLIDVRESIQLAHGMVAERYFSSLGWTDCAGMVTPEDVDAFKLAKGFNSDWDLANAWVLLYLFKSLRHDCTIGSKLRNLPPAIIDFAHRIAEYGGGLAHAKTILKDIATSEEWEMLDHWQDRALLERIFQETYSGDLCPEVYGFEASTSSPGLIRNDKCLLDKRYVPPRLRLGIATGRTLGETIVGLRLVGLSDLFPPSTYVTENDQVWKPDPAVLDLAVQRVGCAKPLYVGDTPDDLTTVENYRQAGGDVVSCAVLTGLRTQGLEDIFADRNTDLIADNVNAALVAINLLKENVLWQADEQK